VKVVTISSWLNFGRPAPLGRGFAARRKCLALSNYGQRAVFVSLQALYSFVFFVFTCIPHCKLMFKQAVGGRPPRYAPAQACKWWHDILHVRIWIGHHYCMSMLACQYNQPEQPDDLDLLTLKVVSESRVTWATSVTILVFLGLSVLDLGPMYVTDRQMSDKSIA